jgi:hypothetical protein
VELAYIGQGLGKYLGLIAVCLGKSLVRVHGCGFGFQRIVPQGLLCVARPILSKQTVSNYF